MHSENSIFVIEVNRIFRFLKGVYPVTLTKQVRYVKCPRNHDNKKRYECTDCQTPICGSLTKACWKLPSLFFLNLNISPLSYFIVHWTFCQSLY